VSPTDQLVLSLALALVGVVVCARLYAWWWRRRMERLYNELIAVAKNLGYTDEQLATRCDVCRRDSVGLYCPYCE
jgi:hypothetical protein